MEDRSQAPSHAARFAELYHQAFRRHRALALWNLRKLDDPTVAEALAITRQLRAEGDMASRHLAEAIEQACRAGL
ncbi:MAG TPA: hypothetical protein VH414_03190 [Lichenihabitans sp.]|jgi:hypothetical protein|nr:hypothetical protein [Lichenihabitans sp.]